MTIRICVICVCELVIVRAQRHIADHGGVCNGDGNSVGLLAAPGDLEAHGLARLHRVRYVCGQCEAF